MTQQTLFLASDTLQDARKLVRQELDSGVKCPCCDQFCKLYQRPLHSTMARSLIAFYRWTLADPTEYRHVREIFRTLRDTDGLQNGGDWSKLGAWGLIENRSRSGKDQHNDSTRTSGLWRMTGKGNAFVLKQIQVPRKIFIYNNLIHGFSDDLVWIDDCLDDRFSYAELMAERS